MSNNSKFTLRVGYVQLNIIKHALQYYIKRPTASKKEIEQEKRLFNKVKKELGLIKQQLGIK